MSNLVTICLVDFEEKPCLYEAPYLAVSEGDEVRGDLIGNYGTVRKVITELTDSEEYKFALAASGYTEEEGLPRLIGKRAYTAFDYFDEQEEQPA